MNNDYNKLYELIKQIVLSVIGSYTPSDVEIGEVISDSPLVIELESKIQITGDNIVLTKNTTDWTMEMTVDHLTENRSGGGGYAEYASHNHEYKGRKKYLVHNRLLTGDKVTLLKESGGQRYVALDRWYNPDRGCDDR